MAPLRHAVRLVDGEQREAGAVEQLEAARREQPLGRHVQQVESARQQLAFDGAGGGGIERGVEELGTHAELGQCGDLVLHQRDQRRDHDGGAGPQQRGELVAQRLAAARGHQHQRVAAGRHVLDDLLLRATEAGVAPHASQRLEGRCDLGHGAISDLATS